MNGWLRLVEPSITWAAERIHEAVNRAILNRITKQTNNLRRFLPQKWISMFIRNILASVEGCFFQKFGYYIRRGGVIRLILFRKLVHFVSLLSRHVLESNMDNQHVLLTYPPTKTRRDMCTSSLISEIKAVHLIYPTLWRLIITKKTIVIWLIA